MQTTPAGNAVYAAFHFETHSQAFRYASPCFPTNEGQAVIGSDEVVLQRCSTPLRILPAGGKTYRIVARSASGCDAVVDDALRNPGVEIVPAFGGLLNGLSVLENILLPAIYHGRIPALDTAGRVYRVFASCEVDQAQADSLCARSVYNLSALERRLVALVRSVLLQPALLLFERLFEGLTAQDMERAARFSAHYRSVVRDGTVIYCDLAGIASPHVAPDVQVEAA